MTDSLSSVCRSIDKLMSSLEMNGNFKKPFIAQNTGIAFQSSEYIP